MQNLAVEGLDVEERVVVLQRDADALQRMVTLHGEGGVVGREDIGRTTLLVEVALPLCRLRVGGQRILNLDLTATEVHDVRLAVYLVVPIIFLTGLQNPSVG